MVKITINNLQNKLPIPRIHIENLIHQILKKEEFNQAASISICFTDNALIKKLNTRFLRANCPTDVLAFNLADKKNRQGILADIAISVESAISNARSFKTTPRDELLLYVAHGILHILGFGDRTPAQIKLMRKKESQYVN